MYCNQLKDDGKADTPNSSDQSPRGPGGNKRPKTQRKRRPKAGGPGAPTNGQPVMTGMPHQVQVYIEQACTTFVTLTVFCKSDICCFKHSHHLQY